ncbi:MAG: hypothetical protein JW913_04470 [Chitinispirillaceae bacterium]|nr:hypothetical protein [Chitinispirillaceae bacterium]
MKKNNRKYALPIVTALLCIAGLLILAGCTGNDINGTSGKAASHSGAAAVTIRAGKIGVLAKSKTIEMEKLIIEISVKGMDTIVVTDTAELSGHGETVVNKTFPGLNAPQDFTLNVQSLDATGEVIHNGLVDFTTIPADTVDVSLDLDAQYSMLRVSFNDIPDSVSSVRLGIAGTDTLDSAFTAGSVYDRIVA